MHLSPVVRKGDLLFLSGQVALDPETLDVIAPGDAATQARVCLERVRAVLEGAGATLADVARIECFLADRSAFPAWDAAFRERFPLDPPARTTIVCGLAIEGLVVEVQATAALTTR